MESNKYSKGKTLSRIQREQLLDHCGQIHDDDCIDPQEYFKPGRQLGKADKKARQLCRQAAHTLDFVLADCDDESMQSLLVASVQPAPDSSRLLVMVEANVPPDQFDRSFLLAGLQSQTPRLRAELARSINRKRVPNLIFNVVARTDLDATSLVKHVDQSEESNG